MIKVGIITILDENNYGNRLQNYATQEILKKENCDVETIKNNDTLNKKDKLYGLRIIKYVKNFFIRIISKKSERKSNFKYFKNNIKYSKFLITPYSSVNKKYDYFIVGSDQVWNPYICRMRDVDLLTFAEDKKRISLSASIAIDKIPIELENFFDKNLKKFVAISVREESGKKIIEELTGRKDVEVLVDPTMLLSSDEWDKVSKKPDQIKENKKYILNYFLGQLKDEWKSEIDRIAKENDCTIINILDKNDPFYVSGPSEFLYLEKNAFLICTDSFHSSVFGIIYDTPFIVFDRVIEKSQSMNSRIDTLLSKFKLEDRRFNGSITNELLTCDYSKAKEILKIEKEKSINFLKKALDIKE